jgi:hypothetical protein
MLILFPISLVISGDFDIKDAKEQVNKYKIRNEVK